MANVKAKVDEELKKIDLGKNIYTVEFATTKGPIRLAFYPDAAPGHVKNMVALARIGFYDGVKFHRVIKDFMIQGGCPDGTGSGGPGYQIKAEFNKNPHVAGTLSMARTNDPHSAGSQFFLCTGTRSFLDNNYTVFGKTADDESLKTVLTIENVATRNEKPTEDVKITKATVTETPK